MRRFTLLLSALVSLCSLHLAAQSCQNTESCPISTTCRGDYGKPRCHGPGDDPNCSLSNPDPCQYPPYGCASNETLSAGCCVTATSPIVVSLNNAGFHLTDASAGVLFTIFPDSTKLYHVAWPALGSRNAWLVLDRNGNGTIDDFGEFFGNLTAQPDPPLGQERNGFLALAVFDKPEQRGNNDGWISKADAIFPRLRVWLDINHDGISQPTELLTLEDAGIISISLDYRLSKKVDVNGNVFRYRSVIEDDSGGAAGMAVYDVFVKFDPAVDVPDGAFPLSTRIPSLNAMKAK